MDEQILFSRIDDAIRLKNVTGVFKAVGFLSESEIAKVKLLSCLKGERYDFFGGYEDAERRFFISLPDWCESGAQTGVLKSFTFTYRKCDKLSHKDFLGTFMSLGITRESIGDILCEEGRTVAFVAENVSKYIALQIEKVGGVGVTITEGFSCPLPLSATLKEFTDTVASFRLDCIVAALIGTSREKAKEIILEKRVSVNALVNDKVTAIVPMDAKISIRGEGKFLLSPSSETTKKGRLILKYSKYV